MIVTKPVSAQEKDLLLGNEHEDLIFTNGEDEILLQLDAPATGWTHELLEKASEHPSLAGKLWDAYLEGCWIGSSEV
ncbi:hypothetical protein [Vogesella indigofera]|uniref:Uncharacterized protein n=1 Tax=Vogesella indigofera TaxID=45465 RepID=A0ABT5I932_VOGIN|nr:hypothetical protein [Vogesella indigofera]MDC7692532.1 hypothetical protein [Vogesella indigofera]